MNRVDVFYPDKLPVQASVEVGKLVRVDAHEVEGCGMEMPYMQTVFDGSTAEFVSLAITDAAFNPAACHPHGEAVRVMVPAGSFCVFGGRLAAKFTAPNDEGFVEEALLLEIFQQTGDRFVRIAGVFVVVLLQVTVGVPVGVIVVAARVNLDEADATLDKSAGKEAFAAEIIRPPLVDTVEVFDVLGLVIQVNGLGGGGLHAVGQLIIGDPGGKVGIVVTL